MRNFILAIPFVLSTCVSPVMAQTRLVGAYAFHAIDNVAPTLPPAHKSAQCYVIRRAVDRNGEKAVLDEARSRGFSEEHIQATALRCLGRKV